MIEQEPREGLQADAIEDAPYLGEVEEATHNSVQFEENPVEGEAHAKADVHDAFDEAEEVADEEERVGTTSSARFNILSTMVGKS